VNRISGPETDACNLTINLSTAGLAEDCFSVPFGGCVGAREDGVDLSEGAAAESATFFLSPASCVETGVEGRGECAAPFYRDLVSAYPSRRSTRSYLGNHIRRSP
jgi:hypothetical protein